MSRSYEVAPSSWWHPVSDRDVVVVAGVAVTAVWSASIAVVCVLVAAVAILRRTAVLLVLCLVVGVVAAWRSEVTWRHAVPRHTGEFIGWAGIVGDPTPSGPGLRVTFEIDGERFESWAYGSSRRRLVDRQAGEQVYVEGARRALGSNARRAQERHVVGRFDLRVVGDWREGVPLYRTATRVRRALRRAAESVMAADDAALFTGLVIGDDSRQPRAMVEAFRASGLSHLTAVSGENVAFLIAACAPLLRRLRAWWRWTVTVALVGWFMALTRFEPSVLRAGVMAMLASTAYVLGRQHSVLRLLASAVTVLVVVDPMLVWSVGFWLSTGATAGVCLVAPLLADALPGPPWLRAPMSVTLGAQVGVALPSWLVFHRLPLLSVPANLLAVPVAGFVMLFGIPAGLVAAAAPPLAPLVMAPCTVATRWVSTVAYLGARLDPPAALATVGWLLIALAVVAVLARHRWRLRLGDVPI